MTKSVETDFATFNVEEMFISRTDTKGLIQSGNSVFLRVANYRFDELFMRPHNIIRHPDMPKTVFKFFWQQLKEGKAIAAYVKNRNKDGLYYWVLATALPTKDGYLSIHIKPPHKSVQEIALVYQAILEAESRSTDAGELELHKALSSLGFNNYQQFANTILENAFAERDLAVVRRTPESVFEFVSVADRGLAHLYEYAARANDVFGSAAKKFHSAVKEINFQDSEAQKVSASCDKLHYLAANMSIAAQKLGRDGSALGVVASSFQQASSQVKSKLEVIQKNFGLLPTKIEHAITELYVSKLQVDMLGFQLLEVLDLKKGDPDFGLSKSSRIQECERLIVHVEQHFVQVYNSFKEFLVLSKNIQSEVILLEDIVLGLDLIRTGGKLEGARTDLIAQSFGPFIKEMDDFIANIRQPLSQMAAQIKVLTQALNDGSTTFGQANFLIQQLVLIQDSTSVPGNVAGLDGQVVHGEQVA